MKMFSRAWKALSPDDRDWFKQNKHLLPAPILLSAISEGREACALYQLGIMNRPDATYSELLFNKALETDMIATVRVMSAKWFEDFSSFHGRIGALEKCFIHAAKKNHHGFWQELCVINSGTPSWHRVSEGDLLRISAENGWDGPWKLALTHGRAMKPDTYATLLIGAASHSADMLSKVLEHKPADLEASFLTPALLAMVEKEDTACAQILFEAGANPAADSGRVFWRTVEKKSKDMTRCFIANGFAVDGLMLSDASPMQEQSGQEQTGQQQTGQAPEDETALDQLQEEHQQRKKLEENFTLAGDHTLVETCDLPGKGQLQIMFNFATRQQIVALRNEAMLSAPAIVRFDDVGDQGAIDVAAARFAVLGGNTGYLHSLRKKTPLLEKAAPRGGSLAP